MHWDQYFRRVQQGYWAKGLSGNTVVSAAVSSALTLSILLLIVSLGAEVSFAQTRITIQPDGSLLQRSEPTNLPDGMPNVAAPIVPATGLPATENASAASTVGVAAPVALPSSDPSLTSPGMGKVVPVVLNNLTTGDDTPAAGAVAKARDAMSRKAWAQLAALVGASRSDILGIYPEFWDVRQQMAAYRNPEADQALNTFLQKHAGTYLADKLRGEWVLAAARSGDFDIVRSLGPVLNTNNQIQCAQLQASHMTGQRATAEQALKVFAPVSACWAMFDQFVADRVLSAAQLIPLLQEAIENNKVGDARRLAGYVFDQADQQAYDAMMREPLKWLATQTGARTASRNEIVAIALARMARGDLNMTEAYVKREWQDKLPTANLQWVYGQMGLLAVINLDPRADGFYHQGGLIRMSDNNNAWRVRAALRHREVDWAWVVKCIDLMPAHMKLESAWLYWKARGLAATGQAEQAKSLFAQAGQQFNFYGQLSLEELQQPITIPKPAATVTAAELDLARNNIGLQRAIALFKRGNRPDAVPEWNFALRGMSDRQLLAAAELARGANIYDRVVNTSDRTLKEFDFTQRYIAPFEGKVSAQARSIALDPAWVYGLIRQESRFIMDAKSVVGASGLMQLMPATAKWVANKIGMTDFHPGRVTDFDTNTKLGTNYLSMVLNDLGGSQVLASAGYNAGPGRPMQWRAKLTHAVEGAIFAETIPFNETRDYVKNVLSNATYYAALFSGQTQSLKERLGHISPQPYGKTPLP